MYGKLSTKHLIDIQINAVMFESRMQQFSRLQDVDIQCYFVMVPAQTFQPWAARASLKASRTLLTTLMLALFPITPILHTLPAVGPSPPEISTRWLQHNAMDECNVW